MISSSIGKHARTLVAALALGAALVSLAPGQTAHAARGKWIDVVRPEPEIETAARDKINDYNKCTITRSDGTIDFYLPLETVVRDGKTLVCSGEGEWFILMGQPRPGPGVEAPSTGVNVPVP
jgi:hypothetical protein